MFPQKAQCAFYMFLVNVILRDPLRIVSQLCVPLSSQFGISTVHTASQMRLGFRNVESEASTTSFGPGNSFGAESQSNETFEPPVSVFRAHNTPVCMTPFVSGSCWGILYCGLS